jgi:hypothetical protein
MISVNSIVATLVRNKMKAVRALLAKSRFSCRPSLVRRVYAEINCGERPNQALSQEATQKATEAIAQMGGLNGAFCGEKMPNAEWSNHQCLLALIIPQGLN